MLLVEKFRLLKETGTADNKTLLQAIDELCFTTYERFKKFLQRANVDYSLREYMDPVTQTLCQEVSSVRFPDAPPRQFCSPTDRCNCAERVAEEDMCVHEIKARKGYISSLFLPRHMFRERIYGSLKGWVKPDSSNIDKMLGYEPEHMNPDETTVAVAGAISDINEMDASKYSICSGIGPVSALSTSSTGITGALSLSSAPPSSQLLASKLNQVTPLNKKEISNIMASTAAAYNRMSIDQKFRISSLAIELQKLLTVDESQSEHAVSASGYVVDLPTASARIAQPHNRLLNAKDHATKRKRANTGLSNSQLQNVGISSTLVMGEHEIQMNGKSSKLLHCQICDGNHRYTGNCDVRKKLTLTAFEYLLTSNDTHVEDRLRDRIGHITTPMSITHASVFDIVPDVKYSNNLILHAVVQVSGSSNLVYCVSFLGSDGIPQLHWNKILVNWTVMNGLLSHKKKKLKFVYDETIHHNVDMIQCSPELAINMGQAEEVVETMCDEEHV